MRKVFTGTEDPMMLAKKLNSNFEALFAAAGSLGALKDTVSVRPSNTIPFSTLVPLNSFQELLMANQAISEPLSFSPAINPVNGASVYLELTADGNASHIPRFPEFNRADDSGEWINTARVINKVTFTFRGGMAFYSISVMAK